MKIDKVALTLSTLLIVSPAPLKAQVPDWDLTIAPKIGWLQPTSDLVHLPDTSATHIGGSMRLSPGVLTGVEADLTLPIPILGLRSTFWYGAGVDLSSGSISDVEAGIDGGNFFMATLDLVFRFPKLGHVAPFAVLGGGAKWYDFPEEELPSWIAEYTGASSRQGTLRVGLGTDISLDKMDIVLDVNSYLGSYDAPPKESYGPDGTPTVTDFDLRQNDLVFSAGIRFRPF